MKRLIRSSTTINATSSNDFDNRQTYTKNGTRYSVYLKNEDNPDQLMFNISEIHPYDDADYAWAMKVSPLQVNIIRDGNIISAFDLPEWDWDMYEDENEYITEVVDITCDKLANANKRIKPVMIHN